VFGIISRHAPELLFELLEILYNLKVLWALRNCTRGSYDLMYERYSLFGIAGVMAAGRLDIPIIQEINYLESSPLARKRAWLLRHITRALERYVLRNATAFSAVSSTLVHELITHGVSEARICMIPNAADPVVMDPSLYDRYAWRNRIGIGKDSVVIGFVGGFYPWHGVPVFIEQIAPLLKERKDVSLLLVGDGPERKSAEDTARHQGVSGKVFFLGSVDHSLLPGILSCIDIGVMPHSNNYGSPMKVFEYMSMEIPVVAPKFPPLEDVIRDGENGFLFSSGSYKEMVGKISRLTCDSDLRKVVGQTARKDVVAVHNWNRNVERILLLLRAAG
jgi:glycosyltransferase involved in cell wall biosynthesis